MTVFSGELIDSSGVATQMHVAPDTVRKWVQRGWIIPKCTIGRAYLFEQSEVDRFRSVKRPQGNPNFRKTG